MSTVLDLHRSDEPRDVVHRTVEVLASGGVAVLPTESEYLLAASIDSPEAVSRLESFSAAGSERGLLAASRDRLLDCLPGIDGVGRRLLERCTPGPLVLSCPKSVSEGGLVSSANGAVERALTAEGRIAGWVPSHDFLAETLQLLPCPVVFAPVEPATREELHTAPRASFANADVLLVDDGPTRFPSPATRVRVDADDWSVTRPGCTSEATVRRMAGRVIVFVCTGNTCRSPMASALFRNLLAERLECPSDELESRGYIVESAGLSSGFGMPASPEAVALLAQRGIDLNQHSSRPLTEELLNVADNLWTLTRGHRNAIVAARPDVAARCDLLDPRGLDVADPFGGDESDYARCLEQIDRLLRERLDELAPPQ